MSACRVGVSNAIFLALDSGPLSFGGNAMANRFQRLILTAACLLLSGTASGQPAVDQFNALPAEMKDWVSETCPRVIGPALWRDCVEQQIAALTRPGWPNLSQLSAPDQAWVADTCPTILGPSLWRDCVELQISALAPDNSPYHGSTPAPSPAETTSLPSYRDPSVRVPPPISGPELDARQVYRVVEPSIYMILAAELRG